LEVYKLSRHLSKEIFEISKKFPKEEMFSLTDQIRRSSRSVGAQIAEAWAKRKYEKHFVSNSQTPTANNWRHSTGLKLLQTVAIFLRRQQIKYCKIARLLGEC
jgi:four helix bundle protein